MKAILLSILVALMFLGEYSSGQMMIDPPLMYEGTGRVGDPLALYNPQTDRPIYIPMDRGKFTFEFEGVIYQIIPIQYEKIQVYRR